MHIIFLSPHCDPQAKIGTRDSGGQCIYEYDLASHLSELPETRVTIFCLQKPGMPRQTIISTSFRIIRIPTSQHTFVCKEYIEKELDQFAENVVAFIKEHQQEEVVLHGHYWDGGKAALLIKKIYGKHIPFIWTPHSLGISKRKNCPGFVNEYKYNFIPRICWESYAMLFADKILVSTEDERQQVIEDYGTDEKRILVIPPGINPVNFPFIKKEKARKFLHLPEKKTILMSLGRLDYRKGYHHAITTLAHYKNHYNPNTILTIFAGTKQQHSQIEKEYFQDIQQQAAAHDVADSIIFRDVVPHEEVRYIYAASDVYLCLSEYEPFGLTVIESMYANTPVIATEHGGPKAIITHGQHGFISKPQAYHEIANHIHTIVSTKKIREALTQRAKDHIHSNYTWHSLAKKFHGLYGQVLSNSPHYSLSDYLKSNIFLQHSLI